MPVTAPAVPRAGSAWVPIRSLGERHRARVLGHLIALDEADRYLRFGQVASNEQIAQYVNGLDFAADEIFGIFNRRLELIALAHLAYGEGHAAAEFGVSVLRKARGRGYGARLFAHAVLHARNRDIDMLVIHALSENAAMLRIARKAGAVVERSGPEAEAQLRLPPDDFASHGHALIEAQAAEVDYRLKRHAKRYTHWLAGVAAVKKRFEKVLGAAVE